MTKGRLWLAFKLIDLSIFEHRMFKQLLNVVVERVFFC